jgi:transketolase
LDKTEKAALEKTARKIRCLLMDELGTLGIGHVGGSLSIVDALTVLYFGKMKINPKDPTWDERDRLILSKGHAGPALYAALAERGYFDRALLKTLNQPGTSLPSHCDMRLTTGVDMTAGSLGQGISCAAGIAKALKIKKIPSHVYCIIGDGESQEGQVWEASMAASQLKLDNLTVLLDYNHLQIDGKLEEINSLENPAARWKAFGFSVFEACGHDVEDLAGALDKALAVKGRPSFIVMHTTKGKGVSFVEQAEAANHNMTLSAEQTAQALSELGAADFLPDGSNAVCRVNQTGDSKSPDRQVFEILCAKRGRLSGAGCGS